MDNDPFLHALCQLRTKVTALRLQALLRVSGSPEAAWSADERILTRALWSDEAKAAFLRHRQSWDLQGEAEKLRRSGVTLVPFSSTLYPALLRELFDPPIALYTRGTLSPGTSVAFVGSRKATPYGRTATHTLVRPLAARGLLIVSGLAYGIDAEAHRAALAVHGRTVAVLGSGADEASLYPRAHRELAAQIVSEGGAVVSEYALGTEARGEYFPQRNRIVAGLARAVVVVEASGTSGALITARLALAENRDVFAVPGPITSPTSEGTNRLLREGATPALSADSILETLALEEALSLNPREVLTEEKASLRHGENAPDPQRGQAEPAPEHAIEEISPRRHALTDDGIQSSSVLSSSSGILLSRLSSEPQSLDQLSTTCTLPIHEIAAALTVLELEGCARDVGGKHYVRC